MKKGRPGLGCPFCINKGFQFTQPDNINPSLPRLKGNHNFRLGIPSYVLPADILPNVEAFAPGVDDIELTLFESNESAFPAPETVERLAALAEDHELTYTIHFPLDRQLGAESTEKRVTMQKAILTIMRRMHPLKPWAWILHFEGIIPSAKAAQIKTWQKRIAGLMPPIIAEAGDPGRICVENLLYPFEWCVELIESFKLGVCIDIGHLLVTGINVGAHLERFLPLTRVIHLHGARAGKTHQALDAIPRGGLRELMAGLAGFKGVITLEIFNLPDLSASIEYLDQCLGRK